MPDRTFSELVVLGNDGHLALASEEGQLAVESSSQYRTSLEAVQELMRQTGLSSRREDHELMGQGIREPIRTLARYKQWTSIFFTDWALDPTEDNRIPLDNPVGAAFISSPEGRPQMITPGAQLWTRPSFFETKSGLQLFWKQLATAGWPILKRRMEETADDLARRLDAKGVAILNAAIATATGHAVVVTGGLLTKAAVDSVIKLAASIGFPITQAAINPGRIMDMTGWVNGSSTAFPFFLSPESTREQTFKNLWADGYGNVRWFLSHSVPMNMVYLSGDPAEVGYHQNHGQAQAGSDIDIELGVDKHVVRQEDAYYIGNAYNTWSIEIRA